MRTDSYEIQIIWPFQVSREDLKTKPPCPREISPATQKGLSDSALKANGELKRVTFVSGRVKVKKMIATKLQPA